MPDIALDEAVGLVIRNWKGLTPVQQHQLVEIAKGGYFAPPGPPAPGYFLTPEEAEVLSNLLDRKCSGGCCD